MSVVSLFAVALSHTQTATSGYVYTQCHYLQHSRVNQSTMATRMGTSLREQAALRAQQSLQEHYDEDDDNQEGYQYHNATPPSNQQPGVPPTQVHPLTNQTNYSTPTTTVKNNITSTGTGSHMAASARKEWRQHGTAVTQVLEDQRSLNNNNALQVRVISAVTRTDLAGVDYTAYVIRCVTCNNQQQQQQAIEHHTEHRYAEFHKLYTTLQPHLSKDSVAFPSKHWAGRMGNWTPSLSWAPNSHSELIRYRTIQLDVWLVHVVQLYHQGYFPQELQQQIYDFLLGPTKAPCEQVQQQESSIKNPIAFTLGSSIRQSIHTVQTMMLQKSPGYLSSKDDVSIPLDLLHAAKGLCFLTVVKAGLVVSGRVGTGLVIAKLDDDDQSNNTNGPNPAACRWSAPCAIGTVGLGWGALVGGDVTNYLVVLTTTQAVHDLVATSSVSLGAELGVAVGPVGRNAHSHLQTGDWTLHPAYAYAHSQGLFVGMSLEGSVIKVRNDVNAKFYGQTNVNALDLLRQPGPKAAEPLYHALDQAMQVPMPEKGFRPSQLLQPPKTPSALATPPSYTPAMPSNGAWGTPVSAPTSGNGFAYNGGGSSLFENPSTPIVAPRNHG